MAAVILSACSGEEASQATTVKAESASNEIQFKESDPQGLRNGLVSIEFYNEVHRLINGLETYNFHTEYMEKFNEMNKMFPDRALLDEYKANLDEHDIYLEGIFTIAETKQEMELQEHIDKYIYHTQLSNEYLKKYTEDMDSMYRSLASDEVDKAVISLNALIDAMEKHALFPEK